MRISDWSSDVCSSDLALSGWKRRLQQLSGLAHQHTAWARLSTGANDGNHRAFGNHPLYQGGLPAAQVRRATALESQALEQTIFIERRVVAEADRKSTRLNSSD